MATPAHTTQTWRFGVFEVDAHNEELHRAGIPIKLREQSYRVLVVLLEHAGDLVTREDLRRALWPADTYVDFDHSLNTAVMKLREALGDTADKPLYIETVPKRGYRFVAPVSSANDDRNGRPRTNGDSVSSLINAADGQKQASPASVEKPIGRQSPALPAVIVILLIVVAAGSALLYRLRHNSRSPATDSRGSSTLPTTTIMQGPGHVLDPVLSPDEKWIAFLWNGPERNHYDIYVQLLGSGSPQRLTENKIAILGPPAWSPDGSQIAFIRCDGVNDGVFAIPSMGGSERKLADRGCFVGIVAPNTVAWLPTGDQILTVEFCASTGHVGVAVTTLSTGDKHCITLSTDSRRPGNVAGFRLSPDAKSVVIRAGTGDQCCDLYTVPLAGGLPRELTFDLQVGCGDMFLLRCDDYMWMPDSKSIVFSSYRTELPWLFRVPADGGPIEPETLYPAIGSSSKDGRHFVYSDQIGVELPAIWRADLAAAGGPVIMNRNIVGVREDSDAQPSPDGTQIVWMSYRSGSYEIWKSDATGGNPIQLTHLEQYSGTPRWSPNGRYIAFDTTVGRSGPVQRIDVLDAQSGDLHAVTEGRPCRSAVPSWSRDGKSIYFITCGEGKAQVWKQAIESGKKLQLTHQGGFDPIEAYDGRTVYYSRFDQAGIWSVPSDGGKETPVLSGVPQYGYWGWWTPIKTGIYFLDANAEPRSDIEFYDFATRHVSHVLTLDKQPMRWYPSLSATADGKTIYYSQYERQSVIKMIEFPQ